MTLSIVDMLISQAEGLKILERDQFCCKYCGLDGKASFENALVMSVDFVVPRARKGKKDPANLVGSQARSITWIVCLRVSSLTCLRSPT